MTQTELIAYKNGEMGEEEFEDFLNSCKPAQLSEIAELCEAFGDEETLDRVISILQVEQEFYAERRLENMHDPGYIYDLTHFDDYDYDYYDDHPDAADAYGY